MRQKKCDPFFSRSDFVFCFVFDLCGIFSSLSFRFVGWLFFDRNLIQSEPHRNHNYFGICFVHWNVDARPIINFNHLFEEILWSVRRMTKNKCQMPELRTRISIVKLTNDWKEENRMVFLAVAFVSHLHCFGCCSHIKMILNNNNSPLSRLFINFTAAAVELKPEENEFMNNLFFFIIVFNLIYYFCVIFYMRPNGDVVCFPKNFTFATFVQRTRLVWRIGAESHVTCDTHLWRTTHTQSNNLTGGNPLQNVPTDFPSLKMQMQWNNFMLSFHSAFPFALADERRFYAAAFGYILI